MENPTPDRLKELLTYDPETGDLRWNITRGKAISGRVVQCHNAAGYIVIRVDQRLLRAHRVGWAMHYGEWPSKEVDHINGIRDDNRICNLRLATRNEQMRNMKRPSDNKSGYKGVSRFRNKWQAQIGVDGIHYHLGHFDDPAEAHEAYKAAADRQHKAFANHG